jgi:hypothetical protein
MSGQRIAASPGLSGGAGTGTGGGHGISSSKSSRGFEPVDHLTFTAEDAHQKGAPVRDRVERLGNKSLQNKQLRRISRSPKRGIDIGINRDMKTDKDVKNREAP